MVWHTNLLSRVTFFTMDLSYISMYECSTQKNTTYNTRIMCALLASWSMHWSITGSTGLNPSLGKKSLAMNN